MKQPFFADTGYIGKRKQTCRECFPLETDQTELGAYSRRNYDPQRLPETHGLWVRQPTHGRRSRQQIRRVERVKVPV